MDARVFVRDHVREAAVIIWCHLGHIQAARARPIVQRHEEEIAEPDVAEEGASVVGCNDQCFAWLEGEIAFGAHCVGMPPNGAEEIGLRSWFGGWPDPD